jgi:hypothetical protein
MDIEEGNRDGDPADPPFTSVKKCPREEADIGGGAAHVEGKEALPSTSAAPLQHRDDATGRTGENCMDGFRGSAR